MDTKKTVLIIFTAVVFSLCGCSTTDVVSVEAISTKTPEVNKIVVSEKPNLVAGFEPFSTTTSEYVEEYNPISELDDAQAFLAGLGFNIDEVVYSDSFEGAECSWFHFTNAAADGGVIYCDDIFYIDYAIFLADGTLDSAKSFRCDPGELIKLLKEVTVNDEPS